MPTDWYTPVAILCLIAFAVFLYRWLRRSPRPHARTVEMVVASQSRIISNVKWYSLTPRQQQVARLAARGLSNSEIARQLDVKVNTVDAHLKKIYVILEVHSRAELSYHIKDYID
jgi:DNA-binding CsgD family transcriptional regulator